jgi:hypothetical protein
MQKYIKKTEQKDFYKKKIFATFLRQKKHIRLLLLKKTLLLPYSLIKKIL